MAPVRAVFDCLISMSNCGVYVVDMRCSEGEDIDPSISLSTFQIIDGKLTPWWLTGHPAAPRYPVVLAFQ